MAGVFFVASAPLAGQTQTVPPSVSPSPSAAPVQLRPIRIMRTLRPSASPSPASVPIRLAPAPIVLPPERRTAAPQSARPAPVAVPIRTLATVPPVAPTRAPVVATPAPARTAPPTPKPTSTPAPKPTSTPTPKATATPSPRPAPTRAPLRPAAVRSIVLQWPNGAHALALGPDATVPRASARVTLAGPGTAQVQWVLDGTLFATSTVEARDGAAQHIDAPASLPDRLGAHRLELIAGSARGSVPNDQIVTYTIARADGFYAGPVPIPKMTPFSTRGMVVGRLALREPAWGRYVDGIKWRGRAGPDAGIPVLDETTRFAWREIAPGAAEAFVVHLYDRANREIARTRLRSNALEPTAATVRDIARRAGAVPGDRRERRARHGRSGASSLDDADATWDVTGVRRFAGSANEIVVERSERWPLAVPRDLPAVAEACRGGAYQSPLGGLTPRVAGAKVTLSGSISFADAPFAPVAHDYRSSPRRHAPPRVAGRTIDNTFVDWGDGAVERLTVKADGTRAFGRGDAIRVDGETGHVYGAGGTHAVRVFGLPANAAQSFDAATLAKAEQGGYALSCGTVAMPADDLRIYAVKIVDFPGSSVKPSRFHAQANGSITIDGPHSYAYSNCATRAQSQAAFTYAGRGDVEITWKQGVSVLGKQKLHLEPGQSAAQNQVAASNLNGLGVELPTTRLVISPPMDLTIGAAKSTVSVFVRDVVTAAQKSDEATFATSNVPNVTCTLVMPTMSGDFTISNILASYPSVEAKQAGRISGTGMMLVPIGIASDDGAIDYPVFVTITNWKIDQHKATVFDGAIEEKLQLAPQSYHGATWAVRAFAAKVANGTQDFARMSVDVTPDPAAGTLAVPWPTFNSVIFANGQFAGEAAHVDDPIAFAGGWGIAGGYDISVNSGGFSTSIPNCADTVPRVELHNVSLSADPFMRTLGVPFTTTPFVLDGNTFCGRVHTNGFNGSSAAAAVTVKPFDATVYSAGTDARPHVRIKLKQPAFAELDDDYDYDTSIIAKESGSPFTGVWTHHVIVDQNGETEGKPYRELGGDTIASSDVTNGSATFLLSGPALTAAVAPDGTYQPAATGQLSEIVERFPSDPSAPADLGAVLWIGGASIGLTKPSISFTGGASLFKLDPALNNLSTKHALKLTGVTGYAQADGSTLSTVIQGLRVGDQSGNPVSYSWTIQNYNTLYGPTIQVPDTIVAIPDGVPIVHASLPTSQAQFEGGGICGGGAFSMFGGDEISGVFFYGQDGAWLLAAGAGFGSGGPEIIPGILELQGVGGGAASGIDPKALPGAFAQLASINGVQSCSVNFPRLDGYAINAQVQAGDASGNVYTVVGNLSANGGEGFVVRLKGGAYLLTSHAFHLGDTGSDAKLQGQIVYGGGAFDGDVSTKDLALVPGTMSLDGTIHAALGNGTFDFGAPNIAVGLPFFGSVGGAFDFNPGAISARVALHFEKSLETDGVGVDFHADAWGTALITHQPHLTLDAGADVGGDICFFLCGGLSAGGSFHVEGPSPTNASIAIDLPDPFGSVSFGV